MNRKQAGSFNSGGTPTLEAFTPRVSETWKPSNKDSRQWAEGTEPGAAYTYVTRTVKGSRPLPDGSWEQYTYEETVRVPFVTPKAERQYRTKVAVEKNTARLDRSEVARLTDSNDHDYTAQ